VTTTAWEGWSPPSLAGTHEGGGTTGMNTAGHRRVHRRVTDDLR
jgi:hypothetical protein